MKLLALFLKQWARVYRHFRMHLYRRLFGGYGKAFRFDPDGLYSYRNIYVGDYVNLGVRPTLMAELSEIRIGSHVIFGPEVVLIGGGHNTSVGGEFMCRVHEKTGNEDLGVVIEDDVWIGARAVVLRGVCVGRGSIIGAGSVVTKSVPPYAVVAGSPAKLLGFRWNVQQILEHERALYPVEKRLKSHLLEQSQHDRSMCPPKRIFADKSL
jgi:acetyltransferase-like isoleucine patch superfamily enzyme